MAGWQTIDCQAEIGSIGQWEGTWSEQSAEYEGGVRVEAECHMGAL